MIPTQYFSGKLVASSEVILSKWRAIKAIVFDWDGVFTNGTKRIAGASAFNEIDAMGINLLRFAKYCEHEQMPITTIITGMHNESAFEFAQRECFDSVYFNSKDKKNTLLHLCATHGIQPSEILFVFDDVLDFSAAKLAGLRMMVAHRCAPLLLNFAERNLLADYITANDGGSGAIREVSELLLHLTGNFDMIVQHRINYSDIYKTYIDNRIAKPNFYNVVNNQITEQ